MLNKKTVIAVDDWNKLIIDTYGKPYNFQQQEGCKERGIFSFSVPTYKEDYQNDTVPEIVNDDEMGVCFKSWLERLPEKKIK